MKNTTTLLKISCNLYIVLMKELHVYMHVYEALPIARLQN